MNIPLAELERRVSMLCMAFSSRLDTGLADFAASYVRHGEVPLAVETLADFLVEAKPVINSEEYAELVELAAEAGCANFGSRAAYIREHCLRADC
jgi:hypothetical protein